MRLGRWVLLLLPALLGGCAAIPGWSTTPTDGPASAQASGPSWIVVVPGSVASSPGTQAFASPAASPTDDLPSAAAPAPTSTPDPTCTGRAVTSGQINGLTVVPGAGTAVVSWYNSGGSNVVSYRLTPIPQNLVTGDTPDLQWQTLVPAKDCTPMSATVTGLARDAPYIFSLDMVISHRTTDGTSASTIARSGIVYTT
jgi:hypothetical protein